MRNKDRLGSFGQGFADGYIDVPYIGWSKGFSAPDPIPTFEELERAAKRGRDGRFIRFDPESDDAMERWIDRESDRLFGRPNPRGIRELGTFRSKRVAEDKRREAERRDTCVVCLGPMPEGRRSNAVTCSTKCRTARSRTRAKDRAAGRLALVKPALVRLGDPTRHTFVLGMNGSRGPERGREQENIVNYAQELQTEADALARKKLARAFDGDELVAVLAALDVIAERNMAAAAEWVSPSLSRNTYVPWTAEMVGTEVIYPRALSLMTEAVESAEAAGAIA